MTDHRLAYFFLLVLLTACRPQPGTTPNSSATESAAPGPAHFEAADALLELCGPHLGDWVIDMEWHLSTPELRAMTVEEREFMINMYGEMTYTFTEDKFIVDGGGDTVEADYSITK